MIYVGVVGSRAFTNKRYLDSILDKHLPVGCTVVSGGAMGADRLAAWYCQEKSIPVEVFLPQYDIHMDRIAPLLRNRKIVEKCTFIIAFWDGVSPGTQHVIKTALKQGKECIVFPVTPSEGLLA